MHSKDDDDPYRPELSAIPFDSLDHPVRLFSPQRFVLGEAADGALIVGLTQAGVDALKDAGIPPECDLCRTLFGKGDAYYRITLGMDDTPQYAGLPPAAESTVESTSELIVCERCEPRASAEFELLLTTFWNLRAPDPVTTEPVTTEPVTTEPST